MEKVQYRTSVIVFTLGLIVCILMIILGISNLRRAERLKQTFSNSENYILRDSVVTEIIRHSSFSSKHGSSVNTYYLIVELDGKKYPLKDNEFSKIPNINKGDTVKIKISKDFAIIDGVEPRLDEGFSKISIIILSIISIGIAAHLVQLYKNRNRVIYY